ncbi:ElyC/SanA/YdcF family protein [Clostridium sp. C8]|jgi:SanA protein|uniref:DUF218 domain-containing protein n=1 Tax=bioreactor metagenome TaxID=1076179 RepID=A0A644XK15_9ZZZZ|nr:ElyC/SanA/YdcF family protein [Clostridium sp. C8]
MFNKRINKWVKSFMTYMAIFIITLIILIVSIIVRVKSYGDKYILDLNDLPKNNNAIIVLGAGVRSDGTPSDILADRLESSVEAYNLGLGNTFVLSGDHGREDYNEVGAMKRYILKSDIDEKVIFMDHAGFSTYDTMYRAKEIFKVDKAIIVTNEYHLPRALYIARKMGIDAYGLKSDKREYQLMDSYKKRELLAQLKDFVYVNILKPEPKFLGEAIPVSSSDGRVTEDEKK